MKYTYFLIFIVTLVITFCVTGCATPMVHNTKTDSYKDKMDCGYDMHEQAYREGKGVIFDYVDDCMIIKHGWRYK